LFPASSGTKGPQVVELGGAFYLRTELSVWAVPIGIARLMLYRHIAGAPLYRASEVVALAKRELAPGTILDGEGGFTLYGVIERAAIARAENLLPVGLSRGAVLTRAVAVNEPITLDAVELPESHLLQLWRQQGEL
jgi:predicted homoserine dehydrogenase-like protein